MEGVMTYAQAFFGWLLQTTLIASMVICIILLIQKLLGGRLGPRWSYALWLVLLIRMVLPWSPSSRLSLSNLISSWNEQTQLLQLPYSAEQQNVSVPEQTAEISEAITSEEPKSTLAIQEQAAPRQQMIADTEAQSGPRLVSIRRVLPMLWLAGAIVIGVYLLVSDLALWRIVKRDRPLLNQSMLELFEECKVQMGVHSLVVVVPSDQIKSPGLFGFVRPRLLLPRQMLDGATAEEMRYVFLHELAHLRRHDIYLGWLTSLLQVLHWFNPLVWFAFYRMRADRELACDALVLIRTGQDKSQEYGGAIVELVRRFSRSRPLPAMAGVIESKSQLKRRIAMITKFRNKSYRFSPLAVVLIIILACICLPDAVRTKASVTTIPQSANQPNFRKILIPTKPGSGVLSPDGKKLAFVSEGSVWVVPVHGKVSPDIAGEPVRLTKPMGVWDVASFVAWSANGKWIAFNVRDEKEDAIYVIRSSGGVPMKVPVKPRLRNSVPNYRLSLSPDGKVVAFSSRYIDKSGVEPPEEPGLPPSVRGFYIYTIPVAGGDVKRLTDSASGEPAFSPDGKKIAFVKYYTSKERKLCGGLWVVSATGGSPIKVDDTDIQRQTGGPIWSPDGKKIAFTSRTSQEERRKEICIIPLSETGKALASPTKIDLPLTTNDILAGWTPDNKIGVFLHNPDPWAIHTVPASGGQAVQVTPSGWATHPQWSPEGQRIYFRWNGGSVASVPSDGGKLSIVRIHTDSPVGLCYPGSGNAVSPDGKQIVFSDGMSIYTVPVEGGESKEVTQGRYPCWSPDGKSIAFIRTYQRPVKTQSGWNIYIVSLKGGDVKQLTSDSNDVRRTHIDWSPDGKSIAYFAKDKTLRTIPVQGGKSRIVTTIEELKNHDELAWSPDGSKLVYSSKGSIWVVSSDGGEPEEIRTGLDTDAGHVSWSSDGKKLAFTAIKGGEEELYMMENFLSEAAVAKPEPVPTLRQIEVRGRGTRHSRPSFDGKYFSDVERDTGNLIIRELTTNKEWKLPVTSEPNSFVYESFISPDSKRVAFLQFNPVEEDFNLGIINVDGTGKQTLMDSRQIAGYFNMDAWSPDGKYIFGRLERKPMELVRVSSNNGSMEVIKKFDQNRVSKVDVSPDGRYTAYSYSEQKTLNPDIFIYDLEQNRETPLVTDPARDMLLGWTLDGEHIFFTSDRNGTWDGWLLRVANGKAVSLPEMIKAGLGDINPIGFTKDGFFYYEFRHQAWNVYTVALDQNTGQVISEPMPVRNVGKDICPDWSPDGRYLAYLSEPDRSKPQVVRIRTLATGQERELKIDLPRFEWLRWCPDSRHLLITNFGWNSPSKVYKVDIETGTYTLVVSSEQRAIRQAEISADGKTLVYRIRGSGNATKLIARNIETGNEKEILNITDVMGATSLARWSLSPNGEQVAISIRHDKVDQPHVIKVITIETGESRTLVAEMGLFLLWSPDGRDVLFTRKLNELWRISAEGGEPQKLFEWKEMIMAPRIHPDGQRIAFFSGGYVSEMWVMENFLPEAIAMGK